MSSRSSTSRASSCSPARPSLWQTAVSVVVGPPPTWLRGKSSCDGAQVMRGPVTRPETITFTDATASSSGSICSQARENPGATGDDRSVIGTPGPGDTTEGSGSGIERWPAPSPRKARARRPISRGASVRRTSTASRDAPWRTSPKSTDAGSVTSEYVCAGGHSHLSIPQVAQPARPSSQIQPIRSPRRQSSTPGGLLPPPAGAWSCETHPATAIARAMTESIERAVRFMVMPQAMFATPCARSRRRIDRANDTVRNHPKGGAVWVPWNGTGHLTELEESNNRTEEAVPDLEAPPCVAGKRTDERPACRSSRTTEFGPARSMVTNHRQHPDLDRPLRVRGRADRCGSPTEPGYTPRNWDDASITRSISAGQTPRSSVPAAAIPSATPSVDWAGGAGTTVGSGSRMYR